ncbi:MAG: RHS repeat-associated core domain-containing protein, partial [Roseiflexaceae bacterium]|nr:RHS repeat-associated core domain-containing protein [Roseiflexaceae bacterium]
MYYHARYYDPALGRFISPDSIVPNPHHPQALNRYAYVLNNPLTYVDPDGRIPLIPLLIVGGVLALKAIDYGWTAWDAYQATRTLADPHAGRDAKLFASLNL